MFFATPQYGMDSAAWPVFAERVLRRNAPRKEATPTQSMLDDIKVNSQTLYNISLDFKPLQESLAFVSFVEEVPMEGVGDVVSQPQTIHIPT
jgi:hypothetical protein